MSSLIRRWFSTASSVSYSAVNVLSSKRKAFFLTSVVAVPEGSFMIGIFGRLPKVISAAMPDDFLLIPAVSICDVIAARVRGSSRVCCLRVLEFISETKRRRGRRFYQQDVIRLGMQIKLVSVIVRNDDRTRKILSF